MTVKGSEKTEFSARGWGRGNPTISTPSIFCRKPRVQTIVAMAAIKTETAVNVRQKRAGLFLNAAEQGTA